MGQTHVLVVGAGILGLLAAAACVARGARVTVFERGPIPNPRSTSYDQHRVIRALHPQDPAATRRAGRAWRAWHAVERQLDEHLLHRTGVMTGLETGEVLAASEALAAAGVPGTLLTAEDARRRWPHVRLATPWAMLEPEAGLVLADRTLQALVRKLVADRLVRLHPHHEVTGVDPTGPAVRVGAATWRASRILLATGAHTAGLLAAGARTAGPVALAAAGESVEIFRQSVLYCRVPPGMRDAYSHTPVALRLSPDSGAWLVPPRAGTRLKLSASAACRAVPAIGDDATPDAWRALLCNVFTGHLTDFSPRWIVAARDCYYAAAIDGGGARVAAVAPGVLAHVACGGGSFKTAPLVADVLARQVLAGPPVTAPEDTDG